jgi:hypothetical protein
MSKTSPTQRVEGTNNCRWIKKAKVPKGKRVTYARAVVAVRPEKEEINRVRITVGGNLLEYLGKTSTGAASIETTKLTRSKTRIKLLQPKLPERLPIHALPHQHATTRKIG